MAQIGAQDLILILFDLPEEKSAEKPAKLSVGTRKNAHDRRVPQQSRRKVVVIANVIPLNNPAGHGREPISGRLCQNDLGVVRISRRIWHWAGVSSKYGRCWLGV